MNYLLDTHTFIWAISEKAKLSVKVRKLLENTQSTIFISTVTFWEISLKHAVNKLKIQGITPEHLPKLSVDLGFQTILPSAEECSTFNNLIITNHKDPFDRMLVWQAINRNLVFISKDKALKQYGAAGLKTLW